MLRRALFHNFRLVHRAGHWLRHRLTPAGMLILAGAVGSGIFGANTRQTLAFQIFALTAALLLASMLASLRFRYPFHIERRLPRFGTVGAPLSYEVYVHNTGAARQADLCLIDELETGFPDYGEFLATHDPEDRRRNWFDRTVGYPRLMGLVQRKRGAMIPLAELPDVPPRDHGRLDIRFTPLRRGYFRFTRCRLARPDPLGLFRSMQNHPLPDALLVLPRLYRVPSLRLGGSRRYQRGGMTLASTVGDSQEFLSLREYQPGDPLRTIHWRSFAKTGTPVVKEFQDEFFVRHGLVLDTFLDGRPAVQFEEAVSVAASFAMALPDQDSILDLMFVGTDAYHFSAGRGLGQVENMLEVLACVEPCRDQPFERLETLISHHSRETSALTCIFLDWDEPRRQLARLLIGMGVPLFAFVITPADTDLDTAENPLAATPERLVALPCGAVQEALDRVPAMDESKR